MDRFALPSTAPESLDEQIEELYDELIALTGGEPPPAGSQQAAELESMYRRLLQLQRAEADRFRARFEASLAMPIDAGAKLLARARALREELEDLASSHPAADEADTTPTSAKTRQR